MARRNSKRKIGKWTVVAIAGVAVGLVGGMLWTMLRPRNAYAPELEGEDYLPADPVEDVFGNTGSDNMVEPLRYRDDEENMSDRMNDSPGLL